MFLDLINTKIHNLYDSHVHFLAMGSRQLSLDLNNVQSEIELQNLLSKARPNRGDWVYGYGWDDNKWETKKIINKNILDQFFSQTPVMLSRIDGHSSWVNTTALSYLNISHSHSGNLIENEHWEALVKLPNYSEVQVHQSVLNAVKLLHEAGFTYVRDMGCSEELWSSLYKLSEQNDLNIAYEGNWICDNIDSFDGILNSALNAKKNQSTYIKSLGLKFFYDGTLGSETAYLSRGYVGENKNHGNKLWNEENLKFVITKCWESDLEVSVHAIGDQAVHEVVSLAREVSAKGYLGKLNLEHVQMAKPESINAMKSLHVRCNMQPCHWLSDNAWLKQKTGDLFKYCFPWEALRLAKVPVNFGSDAPVESASILNNIKALVESSENGIKRWQGDISSFCHPNPWIKDCYTEFKNKEVVSVTFDGKQVFSK